MDCGVVSDGSRNTVADGLVRSGKSRDFNRAYRCLLHALRNREHRGSGILQELRKNAWTIKETESAAEAEEHAEVNAPAAKRKTRGMNMQRDAFIPGIIVLLIGVALIPVSQVPQTEIRERQVGKQTLPIPSGETSFGLDLQANTQYALSIKGGLVAPYDPVKIQVFTPDNSSFQLEFPKEDPKSEFQTLGSSGYHNFTFESAYAGMNTRAEISEIVSWEVTTHPYASLLYVGIALTIVGVTFAIIGRIYPRTRRLG
jgi:hypothetical protein